MLRLCDFLPLCQQEPFVLTSRIAVDGLFTAENQATKLIHYFISQTFFDKLSKKIVKLFYMFIPIYHCLHLVCAIFFFIAV